MKSIKTDSIEHQASLMTTSSLCICNITHTVHWSDKQISVLWN